MARVRERQGRKEERREVDTLVTEGGRERENNGHYSDRLRVYQLPTGRDSEEAATSSDLRPMVSVYIDTT